MVRHWLNLSFFGEAIFFLLKQGVAEAEAESSPGIRSIHFAQCIFKEKFLSCQLRQEICSKNFSIRLKSLFHLNILS